MAAGAGRIETMTVEGDNPLGDGGTDTLQREPLAASFARRTLALDCSDGLVVGVLGPWGSGKTTFVNFARPELGAGSVALLDFNPWMFSGAEQLVESFFVELSAELKLRPDLAEVGEDLASYGEAFAGLGWLPVVGPWIERGRGAAKVLGKYLGRRREGTQGRRRKLTKELRKLRKPIVVILDDIDRLSSSEIRDIFRLVRLTASFPNVIYVVAFDRKRVEQALSDEGVPGRDYLEKILQVAIDLPMISREVLIREITRALDKAVAGAELRELDREAWADVLMEVIRPLINNMRDVRRYAAAVHTAVDTVGEQIALADLLALEAVRVFLPDVYAQVQVSVEGLCTPSPGFGGAARYEPPQLKTSVERLIELGEAEGHSEVVPALIRRLFPFARRHIENNNYGPDWERAFLRDRRVAHRAILDLYLQRVAGTRLVSFAQAEEAWLRMEDADAFEGYLRSVPSSGREDVIASLEAYEDDYRPEQVLAATPVVLNLGDELPDRPRGLTGIDARMVVARVAYRLLRSLEGPETVESAAEAIYPRLRSLSAKHELLRILGVREDSERELISAEGADELKKKWSEEVKTAAPEVLAGERDLARVLHWAGEYAGAAADPLTVPDNPAVTLAMLKSTRSESRSQSLESRAVRRTPVLAWSTLESLYGDEETLIARIEELKRSEVEIEDEMAKLMEKYLDGWRPRDFDDDDDQG